MNLNLKFRERWQQVGSWAATEWDLVVASLRASWGVEHTEADGHANITGYSLTLTKDGNTGKTGTVVAGGSVSAAEGVFERGRSVAMGVWQPYTPQWISGGLAFTVGNGLLTGRYALVGKTCHFILIAQYGGTTVDPAPGNAWIFSTPTGYSVNIPQYASGSCYVENSGIAAYGGWTLELNQGSPLFAVLSPGTAAAASSNLTNADPFAFGAGDFVVIQGAYETD